MEQIIGVFGVNWKLLAFQIVNFLILLWVLRRFLYGPVLKIIDERREKAVEGVQNAERATKMLSSAGTEAQDIRAQALREADSLIEEGKRRGNEREKSILQEAETSRLHTVAAAEREAELVKKKALEESNEEISRLAILAAEKVIRGN